MVLSSRVGALGEVGGTDLAAPAPNAHLELGPDACRVSVKPTGHRKSCMRWSSFLHFQGHLHSPHAANEVAMRAIPTAPGQACGEPW
jgi:hypothetical protein